MIFALAVFEHDTPFSIVIISVDGAPVSYTIYVHTACWDRIDTPLPEPLLLSICYDWTNNFLDFLQARLLAAAGTGTSYARQFVGGLVVEIEAAESFLSAEWRIITISDGVNQGWIMPVRFLCTWFGSYCRRTRGLVTFWVFERGGYINLCGA